MNLINGKSFSTLPAIIFWLVGYLFSSPLHSDMSFLVFLGIFPATNLCLAIWKAKIFSDYYGGIRTSVVFYVLFLEMMSNSSRIEGSQKGVSPLIFFHSSNCSQCWSIFGKCYLSRTSHHFLDRTLFSICLIIDHVVYAVLAWNDDEIDHRRSSFHYQAKDSVLHTISLSFVSSAHPNTSQKLHWDSEVTLYHWLVPGNKTTRKRINYFILFVAISYMVVVVGLSILYIVTGIKLLLRLNESKNLGRNVKLHRVRKEIIRSTLLICNLHRQRLKC